MDINDDISADLEAAFAGAEAPAGVDPGPAIADAPDMSVVGADDITAALEGRSRDEHGRFKAGDDKTPEQAQSPELTAPVVPVAEAPQGDAIPRSLSPEAKAQFATWPEMAKAEFLRREADTARGVEKLQQQLSAATERYQPLEAIIAPHREKWQLQGLDEPRAIQTLLAAQDMLERDAPRAIEYLARSYGVDLGNITAAPGTPALQADPQVQALTQQVQTLSQRLQAQDEASQTARFAETKSAIDQFASDPKHVYFDNVREQMARLIEVGSAKDLPEAYQQACWSNETIRNLMIAEQQRTQGAQEVERRQQQAAAARAAGGSIAGSAGPGTVSTVDVDPSASIEDDLRRAFERTAGRV